MLKEKFIKGLDSSCLLHWGRIQEFHKKNLLLLLPLSTDDVDGVVNGGLPGQQPDGQVD